MYSVDLLSGVIRLTNISTIKKTRNELSRWIKRLSRWKILGFIPNNLFSMIQVTYTRGLKSVVRRSFLNAAAIRDPSTLPVITSFLINNLLSSKFRKPLFHRGEKLMIVMTNSKGINILIVREFPLRVLTPLFCFSFRLFFFCGHPGFYQVDQ